MAKYHYMHDDELLNGCHKCIWGRLRYHPWGWGFDCEMPERPLNENGENAKRTRQMLNMEKTTCAFHQND